MIKAELLTLVEARITLAEQVPAGANGKTSNRYDMAKGKLSVFRVLRRTLQGKATAEDLGTLDAINDTLQALKILESDETFLNRKEKTVKAITVSDDDDFNSEFSKANPLVLVEFSRPGVNEYNEPDHSTRTGAILDELAPEFEGTVVMLRVPMDSCAATVQQYNVTVAPTVIFFKNGVKLKETADFHLKSWYRTEIKKLDPKQSV
ncbi:thiol reductase thioredoxin [Pseudomonas syringae pv. syringae]|uniref:thioredoxin family protein n=1 Tax=Pseudomonas syringae TaxID=317 RepID=UPI0007EE5691|nr:thioredoxin domain-containing protein [Pseudomonas syringae]MBI6711408.1 thioredoxin [Pseudomonas syringae]OBS37441.1 thiol reductase thioredoxin [Pseudomonas syringae pv. syringae]